MSRLTSIQERFRIPALLLATFSLIIIAGCGADAPSGSTIAVTPYGSPTILSPVAVPSSTAPTTIIQYYRVTVADAAGLPLNGIDVTFLGQFSNGVNINFGGIIESAPPRGSGTIRVIQKTDDFGFLLFSVTAPYYNPLGQQLQAPFNQLGAGSPIGGVLAEGNYFYTITALDFAGETTAIGTTPALVSSGTSTPTTTGSVALSWQAVPGATSYNIYRGTAAGSANTRLVATLLNPTGDPVTFLDIGFPASTTAPPVANTTGVSLNSIIGTAQASTGAAFTAFDIKF